MLQEVKRWLRPRAVVLMYHRVVNIDNDPWELSVSPANFREQVEMIAREYHIISLKQLIADIHRGKLQRKSVVITFDDCYRDNLHHAVPVLKTFQAPATFFVPTALIGTEKMFWWDALLQVDGDYVNEWSQLQRLTIDQISGQLTRKGITAVSADRMDHPMSIEELSVLSGNKLFSLGVHTCTHPALGMLNYEEQEKELTQSRHWLYSTFETFSDVVAYPYGHYNADTLQIMRNHNFEAGFTTEPRNVSANADIHRLGRFQVKNIRGTDLKKQLAQWFLQ